MKPLPPAARCSFCSGSSSHRTSFATCFTSRLCRNLGHSGVWNPQISFWILHCQSLIFVVRGPYMFDILRCSACCRPSRTFITFNKFSAIFEACVPRFYLRFPHCIVPESLLNHLNSFRGGMFKLIAKSDADLLLYSLSHFECDGHAVHTLTQQRLHTGD